MRRVLPRVRLHPASSVPARNTHCLPLQRHVAALAGRRRQWFRLRTRHTPRVQCPLILKTSAVIGEQEVAGNHGVALWGRTEEGFATDPIMVANNLIFVATRIQIQMDSYPKWCAMQLDQAAKCLVLAASACTRCESELKISPCPFETW